MSAKAFAGVYFLWIILTIFSAAMDNLMMAPERGTMINSLITGQLTNLQGAGIMQVPSIALGFVGGFFSMLAWNYSYLNNDMGWFVKAIFLYPISIAGIVGLLSFAVPILSSKIGMIAVLGGIVGAAAIAFANLVGI